MCSHEYPHPHPEDQMRRVFPAGVMDGDVFMMCPQHEAEWRASGDLLSPRAAAKTVEREMAFLPTDHESN